MRTRCIAEHEAGRMFAIQNLKHAYNGAEVLNVPAWKQAEVEVPAIHPGLSLFHCHQQFHMDMGFMAMLRYDS